jgi:hypothetical protein
LAAADLVALEVLQRLGKALQGERGRHLPAHILEAVEVVLALLDNRLLQL